MDLINVTKGRLSETLLKTILGNAGYHVIPFGVETFIPALPKNEYEKLPEKIRTMPDFLVIEPGVTDTRSGNSWLVEVKYIRKWNKNAKNNLCNKLKNQLKYWGPEIILLLFVAERDPKRSLNRRYDNNIGLIKLRLYARDKEEWDSFYEGKNRSECKTYDENKEHGSLMITRGNDNCKGFNRWHDEFDGLHDATSISTFFHLLRDDEKNWEAKLNKCAELIKMFPVIFDDDKL